MEDSRRYRTLVIADLLREETDARHRLSISELGDILYERFNELPDNRTIYRDIEALRDEYGMDIEGDSSGFYLASREFDLDDLSLLADCVYAAKFISEKETEELIDTLCEFCSIHQAKELKASVYLCDRVKSEHSGTLKTIRLIREATAEPKKYRPDEIQFTYATHSIEDVRKTIAKHDGKVYTVTPYKLIINADNYYLLAIDENEELRTYRVDRMRDVKRIPRIREPGVVPLQNRPHFAWRRVERNLDDYLQRTFSMFGGEAKKVTMCFSNHLLDTVIDKFGTGKGTTYSPDGEDKFLVTTTVEVSDQFFGWLCGFHTDAKIVEPKEVAKQMKTFVGDIFQSYVKKR